MRPVAFRSAASRMSGRSPTRKSPGGRAVVVVVVVVPALAHGDQREQRSCCGVSSRRRVAARPEDVRQRVDGERAVPEQHGARRRSPRPAAGKPPSRKQGPTEHPGGAKWCRFSQRSSGNWAKSRIDRLGVLEALGEDPADVRPPEPASPRASARSSGWSEYRWWWRWWAAHQSAPFCGAGAAEEGDHELERPAGLVGCGGRSSGGSRRREKPSGRRRARPPSSLQRTGPGTVRRAPPRE